MIYALVARGKDTVLSSFTHHRGNFQTTALDVLKKTNMSKTFGQYGTAEYSFYTLAQEGFIFLVMVKCEYQTRIAISFLKQIKQSFFKQYDPSTRNGAVSHSLKKFNSVLRKNLQLYDDPSKVDKFSSLIKELTQLQEISLRNMDQIINRGQKIEVLLVKSQTQANLSLDINKTAGQLEDKMWWKNKKIIVGIILLVLIILLVCIICVFTFSNS